MGLTSDVNERKRTKNLYHVTLIFVRLTYVSTASTTALLSSRLALIANFSCLSNSSSDSSNRVTNGLQNKIDKTQIVYTILDNKPKLFYIPALLLHIRCGT